MKYLLEEALVNYSDKNKLDYEFTSAANFTEYTTLEELRKNIILANDTEYFIYFVDDKFKLNGYSLEIDENEENGFDENYLYDHNIGGIVINRTLYRINEKLEEIENDINNIIKDYEDEHESNYDKKDLEKNLKKYLANIKYIKVDSYKLELNNDIINCIVDESINETFHYMLCANDLFNEYVNCELDRCREIIKERFSQENTQTDDFEL